MNVLVSYSRPRGKYGKYIFTVMIYFAHPTEKAEIAVVRPETKTETRNVYSCQYCGRWHTITTHVTTTTQQKLSESEHRKDGRLELYRYDNVEPDDYIELTLHDTDLVAYQLTVITIGFDNVSLANYWRYTKYDTQRMHAGHIQRTTPLFSVSRLDPIILPNETAYQLPELRYSLPGSRLPEDKYEYQYRDKGQEPKMTDEVLYDVALINWDEYEQEQSESSRAVRIEEELIRKTMKAEQITITDLVFEPRAEPLVIEGSKHFIEGQLKYLE
jgi:hypothetical protein